ncbi:MAG: excinuclease ABC subunit UvrC, partial [Ilumatobacteraceae bacterium]
MADPTEYRPAPGTIPTAPGVYRFRDDHGRVVYVGKARSLRSRLNSYFADFAALHPRTQSMLPAASSVDWVVVANEVEALALEFTWIKEHDPRFNVKYRDDKSYPYLAVTVGEEFPRAAVVREPRRKGTRYFGPYAHAWAIRETLDELAKVFGVRTCRDGVFKRAGQLGRPCLLGYIDKCAAPCVGRVDEAQYRERVDDMCRFLAGNTQSFIKSMEASMKSAADRQDYEEAARWRDRLGALTRAMERNAMVLGDGTDAD